MQRDGFLGRHRIVADFVATSVFIHGRPQMLTTSGLSGSRMSSVQITRLFQPGASLGMKASAALEIDAEAMRAGARHVVEADRLRRRRRRDVEDEKAGARVLALVAGEPLRIHVEQIVADDAQLVAMHAGRRAEFADLLRLRGSRTSCTVKPSGPL